ncbi:MAG: PLP-dependent aminotransferase family protein [Ruminococcus sp.]|nr:PLP-dependent aminotransferase family protein [Ruminococcus sp.]
MKYTINTDQRMLAYLQLYQQLREDIVSAAFSCGSKLPSKRILAEETGVSVITVEHAYALLCDEGYIESRERSGYFVIFRGEDGFAVPAQVVSMPPAIRHHSSVSYPFPYSVFAKTMRAVITDMPEAIMQKSPNEGCEELRHAIAQYLARSRGIVAEPSHIIIGSGSEYLYSLIVELLGYEKIYGIESPSYKKIEQVYRACDVSVEKLRLHTDGIDSAALWHSKADILHISPYRSYPSGVSASASKRFEYLKWAAKGQRYIVEDDFESEFSVSKKPKESLFSHTSNDNVIYMNTFSKTISPALRVGYMILPEHLVTVFEDRLGFYSCTVPTFIQLVLARLIENGDFERHINRVRRQKRKEIEANGYSHE